MTVLPLDMKPEGWDGVSAAYDDYVAPITRAYAEEAVRLLEVRGKDRVLDVAAGSGSATFALFERGAQVVAIDFASSMIDRLRARVAQKGIDDVETLVMDAQTLNFPDGSFNAVVCVFGAMFFADRDKGFKEMNRVLADGGRVSVASWADPSKTFPISVFGAALRELLPDWEPPAPPAVYSLSDKDIFAKELEAAGFRDVKVSSFVGTFDADSAEDYYDKVLEASPVFTAMSTLIGDRMDEYKGIVLTKIRNQFGPGALQMPAEAFIATGTK